MCILIERRFFVKRGKKKKKKDLIIFKRIEKFLLWRIKETDFHSCFLVIGLIVLFLVFRKKEKFHDCMAQE